MQLIFDSVDEVRAFVKNDLKGQRGKKDEDEGTGTTGTAPPPLMPPQGQPGGFQPQPQFSPPPNQFPGGAPAIDPAVQAIVARIIAKVDGAIQGGQPADTVLTWFRSQCGAEAANATLDQIKQVFLARLAMPSLEQIAKLMNA